jgi:hypothetical protein
MTHSPRLLIASPHRYPDLARLWHRMVLRELVPAFTRLGLKFEVNIFRDANADQFHPSQFPGVRFTESGPFARDFMEFYDATLHHHAHDADFILFMDSDTFFLDGEWPVAHFAALQENPRVAAISFVPRKGGIPAIFAQCCRVETYRTLEAPIFACRYEFPDQWPNGANPQPGDVAVRTLTSLGHSIVNIGLEESRAHIANFRSVTGIRATREQITHAAGEAVYLTMAAERGLVIAAYDNVLLAALYEKLFHEPFAPNAAGTSLGGSLTWPELTAAVATIHDENLLAELRTRFALSRHNLLRLASRESVSLDATVSRLNLLD